MGWELLVVRLQIKSGHVTIDDVRYCWQNTLGGTFHVAYGIWNAAGTQMGIFFFIYNAWAFLIDVSAILILYLLNQKYCTMRGSSISLFMKLSYL